MAYTKRTLTDGVTLLNKDLIGHLQDGIVGDSFSFAPLLEQGHISPSSGEMTGTYYGKQYYRTGKFLRPVTNAISVTALADCEARLYLYNNSFSIIGTEDWTALVANTETNFVLAEDCCFIKIVMRKDAELTEFHIPHIVVSGVADKEYFNVRPNDENGFQRLVIPVNCVDPTSADTEDWEVKDVPNVLADYGVFYLPKTYSNSGKPTRLVIYCHGAGVSYASSVTGFPDTDCDPSYWLAEGCAVMDIEGNPYNNSNRHGYMPQGIQCYENAYDWIIRNFNICRDGVFLGGRSMGGGMCFEILQSAIPVVAACPVAPVANELWWWNYMPIGYRRFCAQHMGFDGDWPETGGGYLMTDEEYQFLQDNFDKMVKYAPLWRGIENLPDKEQLFAVGQIKAKVATDEAEAALYNTLRFKVKAPVKIFASYEDATVPYARNAVYMYNMIKNAAQPCELRLFSTDASSAHHFEQRDSRANTEVTTVYGETMTAPIVYIEMMQFWRRYEKTV